MPRMPYEAGPGGRPVKNHRGNGLLPWLRTRTAPDPMQGGAEPPRADTCAERFSARKGTTVTLLDLKEGTAATILRITGGRHLRARLEGMGIREGARVRLIMAAPFSGPLLLEDQSSLARVMIGRRMAASVEVCDQTPS